MHYEYAITAIDIPFFDKSPVPVLCSLSQILRPLSEKQARKEAMLYRHEWEKEFQRVVEVTLWKREQTEKEWLQVGLV